jgi:hypothetical protein
MDELQRNKDNGVAFYDLMFNQNKPIVPASSANANTMF